MGIRPTKNKGIIDQIRHRFREEDIWYPSLEDVDKIHGEALKRYGGFPGYERGPIVYENALEEAKAVAGIYRKAAIILRRLGTGRMYLDANHRTAQGVTEIFLKANGMKMAVEDSKERYNFIKDILHYDIDEIERWLEYGKTAL